MGVPDRNAIFHAIAEDIGDFAGLVGKAENNFRNIRPLDVINLKKEERDVCQRDDGLRYVECQRS
jgi:hypothetical protein